MYAHLIFLWYKIREKKVKTLTKNWRDHDGQGHEHTETWMIDFGDHRYLFRSEERKCVWACGNDGATPCVCVWISSGEFFIFQ